jgi:hypothetical protein
MSRNLDVRLTVPVIDGVGLKDDTCVVALRITTDGVKLPLGLWEGSTENTTVTSELLSNRVHRGLDVEQGGAGRDRWRHLHERADRGAVPGAHDQITLPVTRLSAIVNLGRPLIDHPHRRQPPTTLRATQPPTTPPTPGRPRQRHRRVVDRLVDRLHGQPP